MSWDGFWLRIPSPTHIWRSTSELFFQNLSNTMWQSEMRLQSYKKLINMGNRPAASLLPFPVLSAIWWISDDTEQHGK